MYNNKETVRKALEIKLSEAVKAARPLTLKGEKHDVSSFLLALELHYGKKG